MGPIGCPETSVSTNQRCVTLQKIEDREQQALFLRSIADISFSVQGTDKSFLHLFLSIFCNILTQTSACTPCLT
jgi:hypothetical protein